MRTTLIKLLSISFFLLGTSCLSTKYIAIDVMQPAHVSFPLDIVNVAVVDNAGLVLSDSLVDSTTSQEELYNSISKETFKELFVKLLSEQEYFHEVKLYPTFIRTDKNYGQQLPLRRNELQTIAYEMDADAVISIDMFETETSSVYVNVDLWNIQTEQVTAKLLFRTFDAHGNSLAPAMLTKDSANWIKNNQEVALLAHKEIAEIMANGVVKQLVPYWESQERRYYVDPSKEMKEAHKLVEQGKWRDAALLWGEAFEKEEKNRHKARIAVNIALANENLGDIENAVQWIRIASNHIDASNASDETDDKIYIGWYKIKLLEREKNNPKVLEQLNASDGEKNTEEEE